MSPRSLVEAARRHWPHVRAALVAFHLVAIVLSAIPAPAGGMNRRNWKNPTVQGEIEVWARRLGMEPQRLEDALFRFAKGYMGARDLWLRPVDPYLEVTGTDQPWRMFVAPHKHPSRFRVERQREGSDEWEVLFEERSPEATWQRSFFEQERVRSVLFRYAWPEYSSDGRQLCGWIARRAIEDFPDSARVRCRYWTARSPTPAEARAGVEIEGRFNLVRTIGRRDPAKATNPFFSRGKREATVETEP